MGAYATVFPGGAAIDPPNAARLEALWGFAPPAEPGLNAVQMVEAAHRGEMDVLWSIGGNFLDTLPQPDFAREALARVPLRVHQDIVVTTQMLSEPGEAVLLLPAATRYEIPGGTTETTTERRVLFSPEVPGPRVSGARPEWQVLAEVAARADPGRAERIRFDDTQAIREEIARAVPFYAGIEALRRGGDQFQWGGARLCEERFGTPNGRAQFAAMDPPNAEPPEGRFRVSTRRGKQFNSMVQAAKDPLTGAERDSVLMSAEDAERMGLRAGDRICLHNGHGRMTGRVFVAPVRPRNLQVHWPEGNALVPRGACDESGVPDYNAVVEVTRAEE